MCAMKSSWGELAPGVREVIRKRRLALGITQQELATRCGLSRSYICILEREPHDLSLSNFKRIAEGLQMTPSELMKEAEEVCRTTVFLTPMKG